MEFWPCASGNAYEAQCVFFERNDGATNEPSNSADWCGSPPRCACETGAAHPLRDHYMDGTSFKELKLTANNLKTATKKVDDWAARVEVALKKMLAAA